MNLIVWMCDIFRCLTSDLRFVDTGDSRSKKAGVVTETVDIYTQGNRYQAVR